MCTFNIWGLKRLVKSEVRINFDCEYNLLFDAKLVDVSGQEGSGYVDKANTFRVNVEVGILCDPRRKTSMLFSVNHLSLSSYER